MAGLHPAQALIFEATDKARKKHSGVHREGIGITSCRRVDLFIRQRVKARPIILPGWDAERKSSEIAVYEYATHPALTAASNLVPLVLF